MKKILFLLTGLTIGALFLTNSADAKNIKEPKLLKTTFDYAPIRDGASRNASRFTHLRQGVSLYSNEHNANFYKVDLGLDKPYWIEKIYIKETKKIKNKPSKVSKIKFYEDKENYIVKINTKTKTPYKIYHTESGDTGYLKFQLYNVEINNENLKVKFNDSGKFNYFVKKARDNSEILTVNFRNDKPVFGYDVENKYNGFVFKIKKPLDIDRKSVV